MNKRLVGTQKEKMAVSFLENNGLKVIETNYRNRFGEIDIIAREGICLVFVEVKYRKTASLGHPEEAVDYHKASIICKVADYYRLCKHISPYTQCRFDVVAIEGSEVRWYKNAFSYMR